MVYKENFKNEFKKLFNQSVNLCKLSGQEVEHQYTKGKNDAFDDVLQWYNKVSENGNKLVSVNQIIMYIQDKLEKTKTHLSDDNINMKDESNEDMGRLFSFPEFK